jgi:hypothetical protein
MNYLKVRGLHNLDKIDLKTFNYPRITIYVGHDTDGWDRPEVIHSYSCVPYGEKPIQLYYASNHDHAREIRAEVDQWNTDPKKYWEMEFTRLYELECEVLEQRIADDKKRIKKAKKMLKKLRKDK